MKRGRFTICLLAALCLAALYAPGGESAGQPPLQGLKSRGLTPQERRGKQIYLRGTSQSSKPIIAALGNASLEVDASTLSCANCHGLDGRGKPEGGITPTDITWNNLTKSYGLAHATGRRHTPYTEALLKRAITEGLDPSANTLHTAMPKYKMASEDAADLIAYLKRLGDDRDPGIGETVLKIGTILPTAPALADVSGDMKAVMTAYFEEVNSRGGVFNRKIELKIAGDEVASSASVKRFLEREEVFAMTGAWTAGADKDIASLMQSEEVPMVGPLTLLPDEGFPVNRQVFYLLSGLGEQARALARFARQRLQTQNPRASVIYSESDTPARVVKAIEAENLSSGWGELIKLAHAPAGFDAAGLAKRVKEEGSLVVFFLGGQDEAKAFITESDRLGWTPHVLLSGPVAGRDMFDLPRGFKDKILLAFPSLPSDHTEAGVAEYLSLAAKYKIPRRHLPAQFSAYSAAKVLVEGLKKAGKDLSREKLISSLEGLYEFKTDLIPPLTYGPNRRIGAFGAYIVLLDLEKRKFVPVSEWISL